MHTITVLACVVSPDRWLVNATRPVAAKIAIRARASESSAATTAPNAISRTTSVIG